MRCISCWQPWASLWLLDIKRYETRSWTTAHRGLLAVHAAKYMPPEGRDLAIEEWRAGNLPHPDELPRGAILGYLELVNIWPTSTFSWDTRSGPEARYGDFSAGRFAWEKARPRLLIEPVPWKGRQGLFEVPDVLFTPEKLSQWRDG